MTTMMRMISRSLVWVKVTVRITPLFFPSRDSSSLPVRLFLDRGFFLLLLQTATLIHFYAAVRVTYLFCLLLRFFGHLFFPFFSPYRKGSGAFSAFRIYFLSLFVPPSVRGFGLALTIRSTTEHMSEQSQQLHVRPLPVCGVPCTFRPLSDITGTLRLF